MIDNKIKEKIEARGEANMEIIMEFSKFLEKHPELRFFQGFAAFFRVDTNPDRFYEESVDTLQGVITRDLNNIH